MNNCIIKDSDLADKINLKLCEIANSLLSNQTSNISLMGGNAGVSLFWAYYSKYSESVSLEKRLIPLISDLFQVIRKSNNSPSFAGGLSGLGWTLEHLVQNGFLETNTDSVIESFDDSLYPYMLEYIQSGNYDYLHGALGVGMYYLNHSSGPKVQLILSCLIDELEKQAKVFSNEIAWESLLFRSDEKVYNLGLSHGIASIIYMLSQFHQQKIQVQKTEDLAYGAINFLLNHKQDSSSFKYMFPAHIAKDNPISGNRGRLSWCYNDLGISMALLQAGQIFNNEVWKDEAVDILLKTTEITNLREAGVMDAGLCHGTAGIAHIYNRAFKHTGIEKFKVSAVYWFEQSLKMAVFDDGLAGYKTYKPQEFGGLCPEYGFLEGIAGIGLAMISAVSDIEPYWDRALLLS